MRCSTRILGTGLAVTLLLAAAPDARATSAGSAPSPAPSLQNLIRQRVRYVFIIYQENRSFDHYFGTFPGANGIYTQAARTHGFSQYNAVAKRDVHAFRIVAPEVGLLNNARTVVETGIHGGAMDGFVGAQIAWAQSLPAATQRKLGMTLPGQAASVGDEAMAHVDCDTIPYLWMYASRFALFDRFFQGARAPSSPSNVEIIAAQNGETEYKRYGSQGPPYTQQPIGIGGRGVPMWVDLDPAWGPYNAEDYSPQKQVDQTYATVLLDLEGAEAGRLAQYAQDIGDDIAYLSARAQSPVNWRWYEQGYDNPADPQRLTLVTHHLAPHYFGYIANNATMNERVRDITTFESDIEQAKLGDGGLFYLKGGFGSNQGLRRATAAPHTFLGDDDHPGESDSQIAQADVAALVNLIARSKYWSQSAIVITWDDPGGFWDHVPPPKWLVCPDGNPCGNGQRVPMLLISPYARTGVVHEYDDQASVIKFIERFVRSYAACGFAGRSAIHAVRSARCEHGDRRFVGRFRRGALARIARGYSAREGRDSRRRRPNDPCSVVVRVAQAAPRSAAARHVRHAAARIRSTRAGRAAAALGMERNLVYVLGELARELPDTELYEGPELFWVLTPVAFRLFNSLTAARLHASNADAAIAAAKARARRRGVPILWWIFPDDTPDDLAKRLAAAEFRHIKTSPGMALDLDGDLVMPRHRSDGDVTIATVDSASGAREWCDVLCSTFSFPQDVRDGYLPFASAVATNPSGPIRNYALWYNGDMVATSTLAFCDDVAGIYNVATLPNVRRKGFGAAVTAHAVRDGRDLGATVAVLQSTDAGLGVYQELGFRERCPVDLFTWPP